MKTKILGLLAMGLLAGPMTAMAIPTLVGPATNATGVTGLVVGPNVYDVTFLAQTYNAAYPGNDAPFLGDSLGATAARTALTAFLNASAVTGVLGFNCVIGFNGCLLSIPDASNTGLNASTGPISSVAPWFFGNNNWLNNSGTYSAACVGSTTGNPCQNPGITNFQALADFELVPEPGTLALFGLGLAGLGLRGRRKH